jgi:hypothetical protein
MCRRRRVAIASGRGRAVPSARRDCPPQPLLAEGLHPAAHVCAANGASRSRRDEHALCRPRIVTALPSHRCQRLRARRPMCACRRRHVAISSGRARAVPPARRDCPPQPPLAEGVRPAAHMCAASDASQLLPDEHARCRPRVATVLPSRHWRRVCARLPMCMPIAAHRDRDGTDEHALCRPRVATVLPSRRWRRARPGPMCRAATKRCALIALFFRLAPRVASAGPGPGPARAPRRCARRPRHHQRIARGPWQAPSRPASRKGVPRRCSSCASATRPPRRLPRPAGSPPPVARGDASAKRGAPLLFSRLAPRAASAGPGLGRAQATTRLRRVARAGEPPRAQAMQYIHSVSRGGAIALFPPTPQGVSPPRVRLAGGHSRVRYVL